MERFHATAAVYGLHHIDGNADVSFDGIVGAIKRDLFPIGETHDDFVTGEGAYPAVEYIWKLVPEGSSARPLSVAFLAHISWGVLVSWPEYAHAAITRSLERYRHNNTVIGTALVTGLRKEEPIANAS